MKLQDLLEQGGYVQTGYEKRPVSWTNDDGKAFAFFVIVKKEMSAADSEFIAWALKETDDNASMLARRVHRLARFAPDETGGEPEIIPLAVAVKMKPSLLAAIIKAIDGVVIPQETTEQAEKNSTRPRKSGTNSSRTVSAVGQSRKQSKT